MKHHISVDFCHILELQDPCTNVTNLNACIWKVGMPPTQPLIFWSEPLRNE